MMTWSLVNENICLFLLSFPGATESSLLDKLDKNHSGHKYYEQSLIQQAFVIKHYAGSVKYNIEVSLLFLKYQFSKLDTLCFLQG